MRWPFPKPPRSPFRKAPDKPSAIPLGDGIPQLRAAAEDISRARDIVLSMPAGESARARSVADALALVRGASASLHASFGDRFPALDHAQNISALTRWPGPSLHEYRGTVATWLGNVVADIEHEILLAGSPEIAGASRDVEAWLLERGYPHLEVQSSAPGHEPSLSIWSEGTRVAVATPVGNGSWDVRIGSLHMVAPDIRTALEAAGDGLPAPADEDEPSRPGP